MTRMIRRTPVVLAAAIVTAVISSVSLPRAISNASIQHADDSTAAVSVSVERTASSALCPIDWRQSTRHVKKLIHCAASFYGISESQALYIAWRESRYRPSAYNEAGKAAGIYQHLLKYWPDRASTYGFDGASPFNARANIMVTMKMVRQYGWAPWSR